MLGAVGQQSCVRLHGALIITSQAAFSIKVCIMWADWKEVRSTGVADAFSNLAIWFYTKNSVLTGTSKRQIKK